MSERVVIILAIVGFAVIGGLFSVFMWTKSVQNNLVDKEERVNEAWAQVQNVYQRRADLIPNLVSTVRGAADFERETLEAVIQARSQATALEVSPDILNDPQAFQRFTAMQDQLGSALSRLLVTVERYPELNASQNFRDLQVQLEGTENRISTERNRFNSSVREYNTAIRTFPANLLASLLGHTSKAYFQARSGADIAPEVAF